MKPIADELRKFNKAPENKRVSNDEWTSPTDPHSRIATRKTAGRISLTRPVVGLDTEMIVAAGIYYAGQPDSQTLETA